jgi:hypothetical protein
LIGTGNVLRRNGKARFEEEYQRRVSNIEYRLTIFEVMGRLSDWLID